MEILKYQGTSKLYFNNISVNCTQFATLCFLVSLISNKCYEKVPEPRESSWIQKKYSQTFVNDIRNFNTLQEPF